MNNTNLKIFKCILSITSFRLNLGININKIPTTINNKKEFYEIEESIFPHNKSYCRIGDKIGHICKINEEYLSFLERNIEDPNKTVKNSAIM